MKHILAAALTGAILLGSAAFADDKDNKDGEHHHHHHWKHHFRLQGTVDHWTNGQLFVRTPEGQILQIPHMAMAYSVDPKVTFATVNAGSPVDLWVPWRGMHQEVARNGFHELMNYDGTWYIPDPVYDGWKAKHKHHKEHKDDGDKK